MNGAESQEPLDQRLASECRTFLAMLWAGYTRAEAEEALQAGHMAEPAAHQARRRRLSRRHRR